MTKRFLAMALVAAAALSTARPAQAQTVNYTFGGAGTGTMTLRLTSGSYNLDALNLTLGTATFDTLNSNIIPANDKTGLYVLYGVAGGPGIFGGTNDFAASINLAATTQTTSVSYLNGGNDPIVGALLITQGTPAVPEPATWVMMLLGFGAVGFSARSNRKPAPILPVA